MEPTMNCPGTGCEEQIPVPKTGQTVICRCGQQVLGVEGEIKVATPPWRSKKSVLDNVPVSDKAFPLSQHGGAPPESKAERLPIAGHCPHCGAPIYALHALGAEETPATRYSCECRNRNKGLGMETK
jgi:hypothetical protein